MIRRYDKNGDKRAGRSLYRFNSQWRLAHMDVQGYASGPFGPWPDSSNWLKYGTEFKFTGMDVAKLVNGLIIAVPDLIRVWWARASGFVG